MKTTKPNVELSLHGEEKIIKVIKSCRTLDQITTATNMVQNGFKANLINTIQLNTFLRFLKKQTYWIKKQLFPGDKVICISNQDDPVMVATIIEPDWSEKSGNGICFIKDCATGKDYISFSILVKYESEKQVAEINALKHPDRWNKFCLPTNKLS